jgi:DNA-binding transcriptional MerR regulator
MYRVNEERPTVDELTRRAGTVSSTVRLYQSHGLLPPPARTGRMAFYGPGHLARMRLISQLQAQGFSLAATKDLVDSWEAGRDLADVLRLEQRAATWAAEEPVHLRLLELRRRLPRGTLSPAALRRAIKLGLLQPEGRGFRVTNPKFLLACPEQIGQLTATLQRLGPLAESVVALTLRHALQHQAAAFIAKQAATTIHPQDSPDDHAGAASRSAATPTRHRRPKVGPTAGRCEHPISTTGRFAVPVTADLGVVARQPDDRAADQGCC